MHMKFNEILKKYILEISCSSKELSKESNLSESVISRYKNGTRIPNDAALEKLSKGLANLSENYKAEEILNDFYNSDNVSKIDFELVMENINLLIKTFSINANVLAKYLNYDASYLSRIRRGNRIPSNKEEFIDACADFIDKKYNNEKYVETLKTLINIDSITKNDIKNYILNNKVKTISDINDFLKKMDDFDLNDFIKSIKFDELRIPSLPFYHVKSKNYYGLEEMKKAELDFFKATVLSKSNEDIFMCSDMPMEDMAEDKDFGKKWMFAVALSLKKGLHLNIIHNLDRPFKEMMLGLESWIPIYMTGQVSPYYFKEVKNNVFQHLNYVSGCAALCGECITGNHDSGKYYLTGASNELVYYKNKVNLILKKACSLMDIYTINEKNNFWAFLSEEKKNKGDRERYLHSLPLFTISDELLLEVLNHNNVDDLDIEEILKYKNDELKRMENILDKNNITDYIPMFENNDAFDCYLALENMFYSKKIKYSYEEYQKHLILTKKYAKNSNNYNILFSKKRTFKNIKISILKDKYVILSKSNNPNVHFVINHPRLVDSISNFYPIYDDC